MSLTPGVWTPIARRMVGTPIGSMWVEYAAAPLTIDQAHDAERDGRIIMMTKRCDETKRHILMITPRRRSR